MNYLKWKKKRSLWFKNWIHVQFVYAETEYKSKNLKRSSSSCSPVCLFENMFGKWFYVLVGFVGWCMWICDYVRCVGRYSMNCESNTREEKREKKTNKTQTKIYRANGTPFSSFEKVSKIKIKTKQKNLKQSNNWLRIRNWYLKEFQFCASIQKDFQSSTKLENRLLFICLHYNLQLIII